MYSTRGGAWPSQAVSQPLTLPVRSLTLLPEHRQNPPGFAEIAPPETTGTDYYEVGGTRSQYLIGKVRGRYFEIKIAQCLIFHPRNRRRPHGFKTCEKIWKGVPDHLYEGTNGAHHHKAVPKAATAHQVRGDPSGRFFPEAADLRDKVA